MRLRRRAAAALAVILFAHIALMTRLSGVAPVAAFDGFAINSIGPEPVLGQGVCANGGATGDVRPRVTQRVFACYDI